MRRTVIAIALAPVTALSLTALLPVVAAAQTLRLGAGYSSYDLSGTGSTWVGVGRYGYRLAGPLHAEVGATLFHYDTQFGEATTYLFPEASVLLKSSSGLVRPYLATGAGLNVALAGLGGGQLTLHGALGLDVVPHPRWGLWGEFRARAIDPFGAVTADLTAGVTLRP